jgi:transcription elongation factor Elf1
MPTVVGQDARVKKLVTCLCCGAVVEYVPNDVRVLSKGYDYGGGVDVQKGFDCPQCTHKIVTEHY